jgi:hypothetical protein
LAHRALYRLAACAVVIAAPSIAIGENVTLLQPVTPWQVDWSETSCTLSRGFGVKDAPDIIRFEQFGQGLELQMFIASGAFRLFQQSDRPTIVYAVSDAGPEFEQKLSRALLGTLPNKTPTLFIPQSRLFADAPTKPGAMDVPIAQIRVKNRARLTVINTGPLDKPFEAMRSCMDDLIKTWGLDPEKLRQLSRWPVPQSAPEKWLRPSDYPSRELQGGKQALVAFRLMVDQTGKPTDCLIQRSYSDKVFAKITCEKMLARAKFDPALDSQGNPVPAYFADEVSWVIE